MLHTKFRGNRSTGSREEDFEAFYHIWAWRSSWSCDHDAANKFPPPIEAPTTFGFDWHGGFGEKMFEHCG